jgi:hypothetical protein
MIRLRKTSMFIMLLVAALFLVCGQAEAVDKTLTVGKVSGAVAATVTVPITISDASSVGGVAFTLTYNKDFFEFTGLEQGGKVITDGSAASYTTDQVKASLFYQAYDEKIGNPATIPTGRLMIAAATADGLTGTNLVLLNAKFKILGGNGEYPIQVFRTIIENTAAGYTVPTPIPVFVGVGTKSATNPALYDTTIFPVYPAVLVAGSITVQADKYNITGTVVYAGGSPASGSTVVLKRNTPNGYVFDAQTTANNTGAYTFAGKPAGTYQVFVTSINPNYYDSQSDSVVVTNAPVVVPPITLPAPQRLTGSVTLNGGYVAGLQVKVLNGSTVIGIYPVNANGSFQTPPLPPGSYKVYAVYGNLESPELTTGYNWTPTLYTIGGTITGLTGEATVTASSVKGMLQKTIKKTVAAAGTAYVVENLVPADDYIVSVTASGVPVLYYNAKTDVSQANAVVISDASKNDVHFDFSSITQGTISGTVTENSAGANIGVYAFETGKFALTQVMAVNGAYSFTLSPGKYEIFVIKANGKIFYYKAGGATENESEATVLTLVAGVPQPGINLDISECANVLTGKVTFKLVGGDPAANVLITAVSNKGRGIAITGQDGTYSIGGLCGAQYLVEMNPLNGKYAVQSATVTVPPAAGGAAAQNFVIDTGNVLSGKVADSSDQAAVGNAMIYLLDQETGGLVNGRMYFTDNTNTVDKGKYTIADIAHGVYNMNVSHPLYRSYSEPNLSIRTDMTKDIPLVKGAFFNVTVTDGDNGDVPLPGTLVIVVRAGVVPVYALTDANGNCKIYGLDASLLGGYTVIAQKAGFERKAVLSQIPAVGGTAVPISLKRPLARFNLSGTVNSTCNGNPVVSGAYVLVSTSAKDFFASAITNGSGQYSFTDLPQASDYRFVVVPGGALRTQVAGPMDYTALPTTVAIPCGSAITGTVTRTGTSPIYVFLYTAAGEFVAFTQANGSGAYSFAGLANSTTYKVLAVSSGFSPNWYNSQTTVKTIDTADAVNAGGVADITLVSTP